MVLLVLLSLHRAHPTTLSKEIQCCCHQDLNCTSWSALLG